VDTWTILILATAITVGLLMEVLAAVAMVTLAVWLVRDLRRQFSLAYEMALREKKRGGEYVDAAGADAAAARGEVARREPPPGGAVDEAEEIVPLSATVAPSSYT